jgi:hypothetical protein
MEKTLVKSSAKKKLRVLHPLYPIPSGCYASRHELQLMLWVQDLPFGVHVPSPPDQTAVESMQNTGNSNTDFL